MSNIYLKILNSDKELVNEIFNAGYDNFTVNEIAETVRDIIGHDVELERVETNDNRSYHVSSQKINDILNFKATYTY